MRNLSNIRKRTIVIAKTDRSPSNGASIFHTQPRQESSRSVRHDFGPNIFPSVPSTQSAISKYNERREYWTDVVLTLKSVSICVYTLSAFKFYASKQIKQPFQTSFILGSTQCWTGAFWETRGCGVCHERIFWMHVHIIRAVNHWIVLIKLPVYCKKNYITYKSAHKCAQTTKKDK